MKIFSKHFHTHSLNEMNSPDDRKLSEIPELFSLHSHSPVPVYKENEINLGFSEDMYTEYFGDKSTNVTEVILGAPPEMQIISFQLYRISEDIKKLKQK